MTPISTDRGFPLICWPASTAANREMVRCFIKEDNRDHLSHWPHERVGLQPAKPKILHPESHNPRSGVTWIGLLQDLAQECLFLTGSAYAGTSPHPCHALELVRARWVLYEDCTGTYHLDLLCTHQHPPGAISPSPPSGLKGEGGGYASPGRLKNRGQGV